MHQYLQSQCFRCSVGTPLTVRPFLAMAIVSPIKRIHLKPLQCGNTLSHAIRYFRYQKLSKLPAMAFNLYLTCQIFPVQWARFIVKTSRITQWVQLIKIDLKGFGPFVLVFFSEHTQVTPGLPITNHRWSIPKQVFSAKIIAQWVCSIHAI